MTPEQELQLVAAIIQTGDITIPKKVGITPEFLTHVPAQMALSAIYKYSDQPFTQGKVPGVAYLHAHGIQYQTIFNPASGDLISLCEAAKTNQVRKLVLKATQEIMMTANHDPVEAYNRAQQLFFAKELVALTSAGFGGGLATGYKAAIENYKATALTGGVVGLPTPFPTLTYNIKGLQKGGFYVVYAPPKNYKTWLALAFITTLYAAGYRVLCVSTEMTHSELNERVLCMLQGVDFNAWIDRTLPQQVIQDLEDDISAFEARAHMDLLHWTPSSRGSQAVAEVRGKIQEYNYDGQLALVVWDGHYRSAESDEWKDIYQLTRLTRGLALDVAVGQVPILATTSEGSKKGEVAYKALEQEASVLGHLRKLAPGKAEFTIKAIRQGRGCKCFLDMNFKNSSMIETSSQQEDDQDESQASVGGLF